MNPAILHPERTKIVGQTVLFNFLVATGLRVTLISSTALKIDSLSHPIQVEMLVNTYIYEYI